MDVIEHISDVLGDSAFNLLGMRVDDFIANRVVLKGGGNPDPRSIRKLVAKARMSGHHPGQPRQYSDGRPKVITEHQAEEIARVAMELKKRRMKPSPSRVRAVIPRLTLNRETGKPISSEKIRCIFKSMCFDEKEDDPWQWLSCVSQDCLPEAALAHRVRCSTAIIEHVHPNALRNHVAIDPCSSLLPRTPVRLEEQQVAAMGKCKWTSGSSRRKGTNPRAPAYATKQAGPSVLQIHWTPVFARGAIHIHVCNPGEENSDLPLKLNDSFQLAKFVRNVLPGVLERMKVAHGWSTLPRVIVHDKASYMVNAASQHLNAIFAGALAESGMRSWVYDIGDDASWLAAKLGDLYLHETAISHIRRLLAEKFVCTHLHETVPQFKLRMQAVQDYMNSEAFSPAGGRGLKGLSTELHARCRAVIDRGGERIPK